MFFIPVVLLAGYEYFTGGLSEALDYWKRTLLPSAPTASPVTEPYTPPFTGGQCSNGYQVNISFNQKPSNVRTSPFSLGTTTARISGVSTFNTSPNGTAGIVVNSPSGNLTFEVNSNFASDFQIESLVRNGGLPDNCGDLPNPDAGDPINGSGLAETGQPPDLEEDAEPVYEGSPLVAIPSFASILAAALAAAKAAATALEAIAAIADALSAIGKLLDRLKEFLDGEEKEESRSIFRFDFGSIEEDGFLRLYPFSNTAKFRAEMLDLQFLSIPTYYGKYFGIKSPNFYRFKELGYIAFVSPTFGVLSQVSLEFGRCSIPIPEDSIGFFFHLGLEGGIIANVSAFYSTPPIRS
jgi:hypothetical protein